eukprot:2914177-Pleurochrysis_carterae.AAC.4
MPPVQARALARPSLRTRMQATNTRTKGREIANTRTNRPLLLPHARAEHMFACCGAGARDGLDGGARPAPRERRRGERAQGWLHEREDVSKRWQGPLSRHRVRAQGAKSNASTTQTALQASRPRAAARVFMLLDLSFACRRLEQFRVVGVCCLP